MIGMYIIVKVVANSFKIRDFATKAVKNFGNNRNGNGGNGDIETGKVQFRRQMIPLV